MHVFRIQPQSGVPAIHARKVEQGWEEVRQADLRFEPTGRIFSGGKVLAPWEPHAIFCCGVNYAAHAKEFGKDQTPWPTIFHKSPASVVGPEATVFLPRYLRSDKVDFEAELAVVIGADIRNATPAEAMSKILGYTCANDVSARDWQKEWGGTQWSRGKSFDTFCPIGPCIVTADALPHPQSLTIQFRLNGETLQSANTSEMQFKIGDILSFLSGSSTLPAGSLVLTGSPAGVGMAQNPPRWLRPGDTMEIEIEGIGVLRNPVAEERLG